MPAEFFGIPYTLPSDLREEYGIKLVTIETLCQFALIEAKRAGVQGLKEEVETHDQTQTKPTVPEHG
jgi:hypothetical protein